LSGCEPAPTTAYESIPIILMQNLNLIENEKFSVRGCKDTARRVPTEVLLITDGTHKSFLKINIEY